MMMPWCRNMVFRLNYGMSNLAGKTKSTPSKVSRRGRDVTSMENTSHVSNDVTKGEKGGNTLTLFLDLGFDLTLDVVDLGVDVSSDCQR